MKLTEISIRKLPGINNPFSIKKLSSGINVIFGPNGSGKSSLCRLIKTSLWGQNIKKIEDTDASVVWQNKESILHTEIFNTVKWKFADSNAVPNIPADSAADCFHISIAEMFDSKNQPEQEIAKKIYIEMTGGCDFNLIKEKYKVSNKALTKDIELYERLEEKRKTLECSDNRLGVLEDSIENLNKDLNKSKQADKKLEELEKIEHFLNNEKEITELTIQIEAFPENIEFYTEDSLNVYKALCQDVSIHEQAELRFKTELNDLDNKIEEIKLPLIIPLQNQIDEAQHLMSDLRSTKSQVENARLTCSSVGSKLEGIKNGLEKYNIDLSDIELFNSENINTLLNFTKKVKKLKEEINLLLIKEGAVDKELKSLYQDSVIDDVEEMIRKINILNERLSFPDNSTENGYVHKKLKPACIFGFSYTVLTFIITYFYNQLIFLPLIGIGALLPIIAFMLIKNKNKNSYIEKLNEDYKQFNKCETWNRKDALNLLNELTTKLAKKEVEKGEAFRLDGLKTNFINELDIKKGELDRIVSELEQNSLFINIPMEITNLELDSLLHIIDNYRTEYFNSLEQKSRRDSLIKQYSDLKIKISKLLCIQDSTDYSLEKMEVYFDNLKGAILEHNNLKRELKSKKQILSDNSKQLDLCIKKRERFLSGLRLEDNENCEFKIRKQLEYLSEYKKLVKKCNELTIKQQVFAEIKPIADKYKNEDLQIIKTQYKIIADKRDELSKKINDIENDIKHAGQEKKITECNQEISNSKYSLDNKVNEVLNKLVSDFIVSKIEKLYVSNNQPEIMRKAISLFSKFTSNQYSLKITKKENIPTFFVQDNNSKNYFALNELSDGTRIQLFLSVRLAFIESMEKNKEPLPLFFDETLANTDINRFREIIKTLFYISKENNRQIFYLTSDKNDVSKFTQTADEFNDFPIEIINLDEVRKKATFNPNYTFPKIEFSEIPMPDNYTMAEYAKVLGVTEFNSFANVNECHLFYLLRDKLNLLYTLLSKFKIERLGEFTNLLSSNLNLCKKLIGENNLRLINIRIWIVTEYQREWLKGRSKPLTNHSFLNKFNINPKYLEGIRAILDENKNSVDVLIELLKNNADSRFKRFQSNKRQEIIDYLYDNGYVTDEEITEKYKIKSTLHSALEKSEFKNILSTDKILDEIELIACLYTKAN